MKKISLFILSISIAHFFSHPLVSQTNNKLTISSKIDHVMVYQDRALITRQSIIKNLKQGRYEIIIPNLPVSMQDDSVRAETNSIKKLKILDVEIITYKLDKISDKKIRNLKLELKHLNKIKEKISNKMKLVDFEKIYMHNIKEHFFNSTENKDGKNISHKRYSIEEYQKMLKYLIISLDKNATKKLIVKEELKKIDLKIQAVSWQLRKYRGYKYSLTKKKKVKIIAETTAGSNVNIKLSYINLHVNWQPSYDIRVDENKTEFIGYGVVKQKSGEDWNNAKLSYSTAKPALMGFLPELKPLYVYTKSMSSSSNKNDSSGDIDQFKIKTQKKTGSIVFTVPRRTTIPSDNSPHRTIISSKTFPVRMEYLSIPRFSPHAYLRAVGKNTMDFPILQGKLNIFIKNSFVGSSYADNILPGEEFELTLSVNENIRVKRSLEEMKIFNPKILSSNRTAKFSFLIKVENFTKEKIKMNIVDQIPVSKTENIEIKDLKFSHKPAKKSKQGIVKWVLNMKPKEKTNLRIEFTISYPKEKQLSFYKNQLRNNKSLMELEKSEQNQNIKQYKKRKFLPRMQKNMY